MGPEKTKKKKDNISENKKKKKENIKGTKPLFAFLMHEKEEQNLLWLTVSESAKLGGIQNKTIRRAIKSGALRYKIEKERYFIELKSLILYLHTTTKLKNKLYQFGIGQYIKDWE